MRARLALGAGALLGALAVGFGAFGANALAGRLAPGDLQIYETGARYQMYHAVALVALGAWLDRGPAPKLGWAARAWIAGVILFSGSLYLLVLTGQRWLGAVTPLGGVSLIAGWVLVLAHAAGSDRAAG